MEIIGLSGFAGSGKSTIAQYLVEQHGFVRMSFATAVKDTTAVAFNFDRERLEGKTPQDRDWRDTPDVFWSERMGRPFSPRYALQYLGTDVFRTHVSPTIWVDIISHRIRQLPETSRIVIDDVRFVNERHELRQMGGRFLLVRRPTFPTPLHETLWNTARDGFAIRGTQFTSDIHQSEWEWLQDTTVASDPVIINGGNCNELYTSIDQWYTTDSHILDMSYA